MHPVETMKLAAMPLGPADAAGPCQRFRARYSPTAGVASCAVRSTLIVSSISGLNADPSSLRYMHRRSKDICGATEQRRYTTFGMCMDGGANVNAWPQLTKTRAVRTLSAR